MIFCDIGVPKGKDLDKQDPDKEPELDTELSAENVAYYERIKKALVQRGIPAKEIAFVHEAGKKAEDRQKLFDLGVVGKLA